MLGGTNLEKCELLSNCALFKYKISNYEGYYVEVKKKYCNGNKSDCARYKIFKVLGSEKIPLDLYPDDHVEAERIIRRCS